MSSVRLSSEMFVDPAGLALRIPLEDYSEIDLDRGFESGVTVDGNLSVRGIYGRKDFTFRTILERDLATEFLALVDRLDREIFNHTGQGDVLIYYAQIATEIAPARTRFIVPSTTVPNPFLFREEARGSEFLFEYAIAQQGRFTLTRIEYGNQATIIEGRFDESTILTQSMELP